MHIRVTTMGRNAQRDTIERLDLTLTYPNQNPNPNPNPNPNLHMKKCPKRYHWKAKTGQIKPRSTPRYNKFSCLSIITPQEPRMRSATTDQEFKNSRIQ